MLQPWDRAVLEYALLATYYLLMGLGPPAYLLWVWRRSGSRRRLAAHAALLPVGLFALAGGVGAALALTEVLRSPPTRTVFSRVGPWEYVAYSYWRLGVWSAWSAGLLALAWVPGVLAWRRLHPASFRRVTTPAARRPLSVAERDYGDGVVTEAAAAAARGGRRPGPSLDDGPPPAPASRAPRTDYLLWLALAGSPVVIFVGVRLVLSGGAEFGDEMKLVPDWAVLIAGCAIVGWAAQEVAVRCGFRLSRRRRPDQAAGYDDRRQNPRRGPGIATDRRPPRR